MMLRDGLNEAERYAPSAVWKPFAPVLIFFAACVCACASSGHRVETPPPRRTAPFDLAEYRPYDQPGDAVVAGQAFAKTRGGDVRYGAGVPVFLDPVTRYSAIVSVDRLEGFDDLASPDARAGTYRRKTTSDAQGHFQFEKLPPGGYVVSCKIVWEVPGRYGLEPTGGWAMEVVKVAAGERKEVIVTR